MRKPSRMASNATPDAGVDASDGTGVASLAAPPQAPGRERGARSDAAQGGARQSRRRMRYHA